ncbi:aminotransferase class I/II-fold pyridoxal phosphate-dependent enzyme [bacterium]|nr:aminotransferase class I/II-fold pyridoxal phosphate-dependent enzyme [bacterium]
MIDVENSGMRTKAIHGGEAILKTLGHHSAPICQTSTYSFKNVKDAANAFTDCGEGKYHPAHIYARLSHDNGWIIEEKMALLEGGESAIAYNSGMGAISGVVMGLLKTGDHILHSPSLYGGTHSFLYHTCKQFGITAQSVDLNDSKELNKAIKQKTKMIYIETPSNPTLAIFDIEKIAKIAHKKGILVVVDNTFMTPILQKPLSLGADIVIHSATKYISGHGDVVAGVVVSNRDLIEKIRPNTIELGAYIPPFSAWLLSRGVKTLSLRMKQHCENAMIIAKYLEKHELVESVIYPGLPSFPQYKLAKKQMLDFGGMISFNLKGGLESAELFLNSLNLFTLAVSLGSVDSLAESPALMTHSVIPKEDREAAGIPDGLIRLSVGIEDVDDLISDLEHAFTKVKESQK